MQTPEEAQRPLGQGRDKISDTSRSLSNVTESSAHLENGQSQSSASSPLPTVGRDQVLRACIQTSAIIAAAGVGLHQLAPLISPAAYDGGQEALAALLQCECVSPGQLQYKCLLELFQSVDSIDILTSCSARSAIAGPVDANRSHSWLCDSCEAGAPFSMASVSRVH